MSQAGGIRCLAHRAGRSLVISPRAKQAHFVLDVGRGVCSLLGAAATTMRDDFWEGPGKSFKRRCRSGWASLRKLLRRVTLFFPCLAAWQRALVIGVAKICVQFVFLLPLTILRIRNSLPTRAEGSTTQRLEKCSTCNLQTSWRRSLLL